MVEKMGGRGVGVCVRVEKMGGRGVEMVGGERVVRRGGVVKAERRGVVVRRWGVKR